jgi:hypothetical protein
MSNLTGGMPMRRTNHWLTLLLRARHINVSVLSFFSIGGNITVRLNRVPKGSYVKVSKTLRDILGTEKVHIEVQ